ncbi:hypothetical protein SAMN02910369_01366 [Lachnospiraceae bacterium NE2001]|nr:hypothetical protein SAMN02910369_01366 [Lachnospiraceae bacterium NE2001]
MYIDTLYRTRSIGCVCGDGFSYPNKFMFSVCEQLLKEKEIFAFDNEFNDDWLDNRQYDFIIYLNKNDKQGIIIEMDGGLGHGNKTRNNSISPEETKLIDEWKDNQAQRKGISVVRIDATCSEKEFLKLNIEAAISDYCSLDKIDWDVADQFAISNYVKYVCMYYESHKPITIEQLAIDCNIGKSTAQRYIKRGEVYNWCSYVKDLYYKTKYIDTKRHRKKMEKLHKVCKYYEKNAPILASEIAKEFGMDFSMVIHYLDEGVKYGYTPYDREYSKKQNIKQFRSIKGNPRKRPVLCFSLEKDLVARYESVSEASRYYSVSDSAIYNCCYKKGTSGGYIFRFEDDNEIEY